MAIRLCNVPPASKSWLWNSQTAFRGRFWGRVRKPSAKKETTARPRKVFPFRYHKQKFLPVKNFPNLFPSLRPLRLLMAVARLILYLAPLCPKTLSVPVKYSASASYDSPGLRRSAPIFQNSSPANKPSFRCPSYISAPVASFTANHSRSLCAK